MLFSSSIKSGTSGCSLESGASGSSINLSFKLPTEEITLESAISTVALSISTAWLAETVKQTSKINKIPNLLHFIFLKPHS